MSNKYLKSFFILPTSEDIKNEKTYICEKCNSEFTDYHEYALCDESHADWLEETNENKSSIRNQ